MRSLIYVLCLVLTYLGRGSVFGIVWTFLYKHLGDTMLLYQIVSKIWGIPVAFFSFLVVYRLLVIFKSRSLVIPARFRGVLYLVGCAAVVPAVLGALFYGYVIMTHTAGVSGIPLAYLFMVSSALAPVAVFICEGLELYALIPMKRSND